MNITIAIFIGLAFAIMFLFFYIFVSSKNIDRKFQRIGMALEEMNEEIYQLEQKQKKLSKDFEVNIEKIISEKMDDILENLINTIKDYQNKSENEIRSLYDKIEKIESSAKLNSLPNFETISPQKDNKSKIKELFEIGYSVEEIAKEVNMPVGEVQLYLKF
jgi:predicted PurR-regulated permease PerM